MKKGFIVGRFQPFHAGHHKLIKEILSEVDYLLIGIGSSNKAYTKDNPFTFEERKRMVERSVEGNYEIIPLEDMNNTEKWIDEMKNIISTDYLVYTDNPITEELFEKAGYSIRKLNINNNIRGKIVREMMYSGDDWKDVVAEGSLETIMEIDGTKRIKEITDNSFDSPMLTVETIIVAGKKIILRKRKIVIQGMF